jgi:DNA-binding GntR family transcriptional regulator
MTISAAQPGLRYQKLSDEVADLLQRMIIENELTPGQKLTQDELAKTLGVSTMPIREALLKLSALGLIEASPNKSFRVMNSTKEDARDSYWVHSQLVAELTRRACELEGPKLVPDLERSLQRYSAAAASGDVPALEEAYGAFYRSINLAAQSPRLVFMLRTNLQFLPIHWFPRIEGWIPISQDAHKAVIEAFLNKRPATAAKVASKHILQAGELLIEYFESAGRWSTPDQSDS